MVFKTASGISSSIHCDAGPRQVFAITYYTLSVYCTRNMKLARGKIVTVIALWIMLPSL